MMIISWLLNLLGTILSILFKIVCIALMCVVLVLLLWVIYKCFG